VSSTDQILKFAYIYIHAVGWTAPPHSPIKTSKRCDSASQKQAQTAKCLGTPLIAEALLLGCFAFPESRLQSLPHPYSPLRANAFLTISRNPGPGKQSLSHMSFGINFSIASAVQCPLLLVCPRSLRLPVTQSDPRPGRTEVPTLVQAAHESRNRT